MLPQALGIPVLGLYPEKTILEKTRETQPSLCHNPRENTKQNHGNVEPQINEEKRLATTAPWTGAQPVNRMKPCHLWALGPSKA